MRETVHARNHMVGGSRRRCWWRLWYIHKLLYFTSQTRLFGIKRCRCVVFVRSTIRNIKQRERTAGDSYNMNDTLRADDGFSNAMHNIRKDKSRFWEFLFTHFRFFIVHAATLGTIAAGGGGGGGGGGDYGDTRTETRRNYLRDLVALDRNEPSANH
jgi:hypothetical protein